MVDSPISTPSSRWDKYRASRTSWGINVLGSFFVEIEATDGTVGFATGFGGQILSRPSAVNPLTACQSKHLTSDI